MLDQPISLAGARLAARASGALWWPEQRLLAVADLHLCRSQRLARRGGVLLPPYETAATLDRLAGEIAALDPARVVCLGDSFDDCAAGAALAPDDASRLTALMAGRDWVWIAGNHDPGPPADVGGRFLANLAVGAISFRHEPGGDATGEIAGHLHPIARVARRGRAVSRRCFACDGQRMVMPAFGAYAGGLNVRDRAFAEVFRTLTFTAHMLGERRVYAVAAKHCLPD
jgi:DNA ligase-associated metallophosphoesterase